MFSFINQYKGSVCRNFYFMQGNLIPLTDEGCYTKITIAGKRSRKRLYRQSAVVFVIDWRNRLWLIYVRK